MRGISECRVPRVLWATHTNRQHHPKSDNVLDRLAAAFPPQTRALRVPIGVARDRARIAREPGAPGTGSDRIN